MPRISIICALTKDTRAIGINGELPWNLPQDMKRFKKLTLNHPVIMGRTTYESIPEKFRPLPDRTNIILTHNIHYNAPGTIVSHAFEDALNRASKETKDEIFIIGGAQIFSQCINTVDMLYLTIVDKEFAGDTFFPEYKERFPTVIFSEQIIDNGTMTTFEIRER